MVDSQFRVLSDSTIFKQAQKSDDDRLDVLESKTVFKTLGELKTITPRDGLAYSLQTNNGRVEYTYILGDFTGRDDDYNVIRLTDVPLTVGALKKADNTLYAGNFGVIGDNVIDDTVAIQNFINLCSRLRRIAYFGSMKCKVSATIYVNNGSMVFDVCDYSGGPGLHPVYNANRSNAFADGVVNVYGICSDFRSTITGTGNHTQDTDGNITSDTRTPVLGFKFGNEIGSVRDTLILSKIEWARAWKLSNTGVKVINVFDTRFDALSAELCGNADNYSVSIEDGNNTTNESVFTYIQSEQAAIKSLFISPNTLSSTFTKIHAERLDGKDGVDGFILGSGNYASVRISCRNRKGGALWLAQSSFASQVRIEDITMKINSTGGSLTIAESSGVFTPNPNSNGEVLIVGGNTNMVGITSGWLVKGGKHTVSVGFCAVDLPVKLMGANITTLTRSDDNAQVIVDNCQVGALFGGTWNNLSLINMTKVIAAGGTLSLNYSKFTVGEYVKIVGSIRTDNVGVRFNGRLEGDYNTVSSRQILWGPQTEISGSITNSAGPPESGAYLDGYKEGMFCKNPRPVVEGAVNGRYYVSGWTYIGTNWEPARVMTGA